MKRKPRRKPEPKPKMFRFHLYHHADPQQLSLMDCIFSKLECIMSKISEFAERQNAHNDKLDLAHDGLRDDNAQMVALIKQLQDSQGTLTPEDQATLDQLEARAAATAEKFAALDALHPPTPPIA